MSEAVSALSNIQTSILSLFPTGSEISFRQYHSVLFIAYSTDFANKVNINKCRRADRQRAPVEAVTVCGRWLFRRFHHEMGVTGDKIAKRKALTSVKTLNFRGSGDSLEPPKVLWMKYWCVPVTSIIITGKCDQSVAFRLRISKNTKETRNENERKC